MGCDIHLYCEKRTTHNGKKFWHCADRFKLNEYYSEYDDEPKYYIDSIYDDRSYAAFGVLANVRNDYGIEPIAEPRNLPDDLSITIKEEADKWVYDGHSYSWITARELFNYQKEHTCTIYSGMISPEQDEALKQGIKPTHWCQWTNQPGFVKRQWSVNGCAIDGLIEAVKKRMAEEFFIYDFLSDEEKAERYEQHADNFRIVFWFDN